jgi:hypothetical protein
MIRCSGIFRVIPNEVFCNISSLSCDDVIDGDMTSAVQLVPGKDIEASFPTPAEVTWVSMYAHPLLPHTDFVAMTIALTDRNGDQRGVWTIHLHVFVKYYEPELLFICSLS